MQIRRQFTNTESTQIRKHFASLAALFPLFSRACRANCQLHGENTHRVWPEWSRQAPDLLPESLLAIRIIKPRPTSGDPGPQPRPRPWSHQTLSRGDSEQKQGEEGGTGGKSGSPLMYWDLFKALEMSIRLRVWMKHKVTYIRYFYLHFKERVSTSAGIKCFFFPSSRCFFGSTCHNTNVLWELIEVK